MEKVIRDCKFDRISNLSEGVKDIILTFLPLREAVRTSVLSTKWRHVWTNLLSLVFDDTIRKFSQNDEPFARYKLLSTINHILLLHDGPIHKFSLSHSVIKSCPEIDHFTILLSKKCVHEFSLEILKGEKHKLHSSFFSCRELTHMNLSGCIFTPPPSFEGFPRLVNMKFVNVVFSADFFGNFVSNCPRLERLTLINPPHFHCLALSAPNLKYMHFDGYCKNLCFRNVPLLQSAIFNMIDMSTSQDEEICKFTMFFGCLPAVKNLVAGFNLLQHLAAGVAPKKLPTSIGLETLKLTMISFEYLDEVSSIFCLIRSSPKIQKIEIEICNDEDPDEVKEDQILDFLKAQDYTSEITLDELREVHLTYVSGLKPELELIKLLLGSSPTQETMNVKPKKEDDLSRLELLKKLTRFHRASSMAEIIFE